MLDWGSAQQSGRMGFAPQELRVTALGSYGVSMLSSVISAVHTYNQPGRYTVAVKVIDIFGNDTMTPVPVNVG